MAMASVWFICVLVAASLRGMAGPGAGPAWLGRRGGAARVSRIPCECETVQWPGA